MKSKKKKKVTLYLAEIEVAYEGTDLIGIFDTKEAAFEALMKEPDRADGLRITKITLNKPKARLAKKAWPFDFYSPDGEKRR